MNTKIKRDIIVLLFIHQTKAVINLSGTGCRFIVLAPMHSDKKKITVGESQKMSALWDHQDSKSVIRHHFHMKKKT